MLWLYFYVSICRAYNKNELIFIVDFLGDDENIICNKKIYQAQNYNIID